MQKEKFEFIKKKYGHYASWAVFGEEGNLPKSNMSDLSMFENTDILKILNPNVIFVGLNISKLGQLNRPFENFHGPLGGAYKIRFAFKNSPYWGAYMTDIIKDFAEKASNKMMHYLRNNKDFEEENILTFKQELTDLESDNPLLIAFGNDVYCVLKRNFQDEFNIKKVPHYSTYMSKEKYRKEIKEIMNF